MIVAVVMRVIVIVPAVVVGVIVIVSTVIVTMTVVMIVGWGGGHVAPLRAEARQLQGTGEEHEGDQPRDIDGLLDEKIGRAHV